MIGPVIVRPQAHRQYPLQRIVDLYGQMVDGLAVVDTDLPSIVSLILTWLITVTERLPSVAGGWSQLQNADVGVIPP